MIRLFRATNFRCLELAELEFGPRFNLITGANASGKTSLLEALAYLGRGKSFRGASTANLTRHGEDEFVLFGEVERDVGSQAVGVRNGRHGLEARIGGVTAAGAAALAEALPLQVIDPEVHNLIAGGPELRRRYLDWVAFHVEHEHLMIWRRFRRALKQRNAALRLKSSEAAIRSWNAEFIDLAMQLDRSRRSVLELTEQSLLEHGHALLQTELAFEYQAGWPRDKSLAAALDDGLERDLQTGGEPGGTAAGGSAGDQRRTAGPQAGLARPAEAAGQRDDPRGDRDRAGSPRTTIAAVAGRSGGRTRQRFGVEADGGRRGTGLPGGRDQP